MGNVRGHHCNPPPPLFTYSFIILHNGSFTFLGFLINQCWMVTQLFQGSNTDEVRGTTQGARQAGSDQLTSQQLMVQF